MWLFCSFQTWRWWRWHLELTKILQELFSVFWKPNTKGDTNWVAWPCKPHQLQTVEGISKFGKKIQIFAIHFAEGFTISKRRSPNLLGNKWSGKCRFEPTVSFHFILKDLNLKNVTFNKENKLRGTKCYLSWKSIDTENNPISLLWEISVVDRGVKENRRNYEGKKEVGISTEIPSKTVLFSGRFGNEDKVDFFIYFWNIYFVILSLLRDKWRNKARW